MVLVEVAHLAERKVEKRKKIDAAACEEAKDPVEIVQEDVLVAVFDWEVEDVIASCVARQAMNCIYPSMLAGLMGPTLS